MCLEGLCPSYAVFKGFVVRVHFKEFNLGAWRHGVWSVNHYAKPDVDTRVHDFLTNFNTLSFGLNSIQRTVVYSDRTILCLNFDSALLHNGIPMVSTLSGLTLCGMHAYMHDAACLCKRARTNTLNLDCAGCANGTRSWPILICGRGIKRRSVPHANQPIGPR